jgi:hypothetical protein
LEEGGARFLDEKIKTMKDSLQLFWSTTKDMEVEGLL